MPRVLVTYATKYGSTQEVAEAIGTELTASGLQTDVIQANPKIEVRKYDAVVIGSPLYGSKWLADAAVFIVANAAALESKPVALFSTGMIGVKNPKWGKNEHVRTMESVRELAPGMDIRTTALFDGAYDRAHLPLCLRVMDWLAGTPSGDHRNWDAIAGWARRTADLLTATAVRAGTETSATDDDENSGGSVQQRAR